MPPILVRRLARKFLDFDDNDSYNDDYGNNDNDDDIIMQQNIYISLFKHLPKR